MKTRSKDTAWPPAGVRDLTPDSPVSAKPDRQKFPTLRRALTAVTPDMLTEQIVRETLSRNRGYRDAEYLCRAYLQFGSDAMSPNDLRRLCSVINKLNK